jgi:hypothetical protein
MAFRATNVLPSTAYDLVRRAAVQLRVNLQAINVRLAAEAADYDYLKSIYRTLDRADDQFNTLKTTPGLEQYAKDLEVDQAYDVVAEFSAMQASIGAAKTWMEGNVPTNVTIKDPSTWDDTTMISNTFSPAQTAGLRTQLTLVIAEIV